MCVPQRFLTVCVLKSKLLSHLTSRNDERSCFLKILGSMALQGSFGFLLLCIDSLNYINNDECPHVRIHN